MNFRKYKLELGTRILKARIAKGMTQAQLAQAIGRSQSSITQIESGKVLPKTDTLFALGKALNMPVGKLFPETVPNRVLGSSLIGVLWIRLRHWWYLRKRNNSGSAGS